MKRDIILGSKEPISKQRTSLMNPSLETETTELEFPSSPPDWSFHTPSIASPSFINCGVPLDSHELPVIQDTTRFSRKDTFCSSSVLSPNSHFLDLSDELHLLENHQSPLLSESQTSLRSFDGENDDTTQLGQQLFSNDVSDDLLEFVLRLTDTPPGAHSPQKKSQQLSNVQDKAAEYNRIDEADDRNSFSSPLPQLIEDMPSAFGNPGRTPCFNACPSRNFATHYFGKENQCVLPMCQSEPLGKANNSNSVTTPASTQRCHDGTGRSTVSLVSNHGFGSITTAASTPSCLPSTPTWSQELPTTAAAAAAAAGIAPATRAAASLLGITCQDGNSRHPKVLVGSLLCSPCPSDTSRLDQQTSLMGETTTACSATPYFPSSSNRLIDCPRGDCDVHLPIHQFASRPVLTESSTRIIKADAKQSFQLSPQVLPSGLKHLHTTTTTNGSNRLITTSTISNGEDETQMNRSGGGGTTSQYQNYNNNEINWDEMKERRLLNGSNGGISKGLTDFYSLAYASKRWQNLNVVLPLFIPHGTIAVLRPTGENTYLFSDQYPASQLLFSGSGKICDLWATYLRLRVAVIHKCPEFLVPRVAQVFNNVLANMPQFPEPIHLRCSGMVKHTIQLRSSGGLTFRYDTIGQISNSVDQEKMRILFERLQKVMTEVNNHLAREVEEAFRSLQCGNIITSDEHEINNNNESATKLNPKCGLEFRFSPCKELKIAIREGTVCDCGGVDSVIAGGGASSMSTWAQQFVVENLIVGEVRLERDKTSETQVDPFFLPHYEVKTRMISRDLDGNAARLSFVDPAVYPTFYRPRIEYAIGLSPLQAAEQICGATHQTLSALLPNGMLSLATQTNQELLHIPGVVGNSSQPFAGTLGVTPTTTTTTTTMTPTTTTYTDRAAASSLNNNTYSRHPYSPYSSSPKTEITWPKKSDAPLHDPLFPSHWTSQRIGNDFSMETTQDALKGLALIQKLVTDMGGHGTSEKINCEHLNTSPSSKNQQQQVLQSFLGQAAAAAVVLSRHQSTVNQSPETKNLFTQLQTALQKVSLIQDISNYTPQSSMNTTTHHDTDDECQQQSQQHHHPLPFPILSNILNNEGLYLMKENINHLNHQTSISTNISSTMSGNSAENLTNEGLSQRQTSCEDDHKIQMTEVNEADH